MSVNIGSTYLDLVKAVSEMADSDPDCPTLVGADQIKGIYATAGNRSIWDVDAAVGITFQEKGTLFKDENASSKITDTLFVQRVPIVAGNNVTFETDTENQVVKINATGGTSGETDSSIIDLGTQEDHKVAQQTMVDHLISTNVEDGCYLFKYWCDCRLNACFAIVFISTNNDSSRNIAGTIYDNTRRYREFVYDGEKFRFDGCWTLIANWDEERDNLTTEDKTLLGAINELNAKVPTKIEGDDAHVDIDSGDVGIQGNYIYVGGNAEGGDAVFIEAVNDGNIDIHSHEGDLTLRSFGKLAIEPKGRRGIAGQVLMSDGQSAYWGDVEGSRMTRITYAELKALRDSGKLVAGMFYRITDYVCTTVQAETRAMSNRFDIIVQALSNNTLSETAKADYNAEDNYFKTESGGNALVEGSVTKYYDIYEDCDTVEDKTANYKSNDTFVEYGYLENNEGVTVPVLYKNDLDSYADEGADYGDTFYYIGTYEYEGTTYDRWRKIEASGYGWDSTGNIYALTNVIVENNEIISSVKASGIKYNANLPAWELKYSLDNDTTRFAWAMEGQAITNLYSIYSNGRPLVRQPSMDGRNPSEYESFNIYNYAWGTQEDVDDDDGTSFVYSLNPTITNGEVVYNANDGELQTAEVVEGKGVIYFMKDEHNNECPYDFKNIQFKRSKGWQEEHIQFIEDSLFLSFGDVEWFYTFSWVNEDLSVDDLTLRQDLTSEDGFPYGTHSNKIKPYKTGTFNNEAVLCLLNNILMINTYYSYEDNISPCCFGNTFGYDCHNNIFGSGCWNNTFGVECGDNIIGELCVQNAFGARCSNNTVGNDCNNNTFGDSCTSNTFGTDCDSNTFGNNCHSNTFGNSCHSNTFGNDCFGNTFGNDCFGNTFGIGCHSNKMQVDSARYVYVLSSVNNKTLTPVPNASYEQIFKPTGTVETEV